MSRYLLDTDTLIDFSKAIEPVTTRILAWIDSTDVVAVCAISVAEFYSGLRVGEADKAERLVNSLPYIDISRTAAERAGRDRHALARRGFTITTTDALLAAAAREYHATLVTSNVRDFPMDDVSVMSIRA